MNIDILTMEAYTEIWITTYISNAKQPFPLGVIARSEGNLPVAYSLELPPPVAEHPGIEFSDL